MKPLCEWTNHLHRGFLLLLKIFQRPQDAQPSPNGDDLGGLGGIPQQAFWPVQSGQNRKTCICLHCLPICENTIIQFYIVKKVFVQSVKKWHFGEDKVFPFYYT